MSDTVSSAEFDGQHVQLLPARTVLSMFSAVGEGTIPDGGGLVEVVKTVTGMASSTSGSDGGAGSGDNSR